MMKNFYEEHKRYKELKEKLEYDLQNDLTDIIGDAIMHGMNKIEEVLMEGRHGNSTSGAKD